MSATPPEHSVRSTFADDPEMQELIEFFVSEIPNRIEEMQQAWDAQDLETLSHLTHQLKGASGGYGFQVISDAATSLELPLKEGQADLDDLATEYAQLIELCNRVMF